MIGNQQNCQNIQRSQYPQHPQYPPLMYEGEKIQILTNRVCQRAFYRREQNGIHTFLVNNGHGSHDIVTYNPQIKHFYRNGMITNMYLLEKYMAHQVSIKT